MRFVLAVAETGTVSGAARRLGVNHATVLRRVDAFEDRHKVQIFDRTPKGYTVRGEQKRLIEAARDVSNAVQSVESLLDGGQAPLVGTVRVSSTDTFCQFVLPQLVGAFHNDVSRLKIALISTNAYSDFSRSHADVAVRPTTTLSDDMIGDVAAYLGFGVYARPDVPDVWLGLSGQLTRAAVATWMSEHVNDAKIVGAADSFVVLGQMARQGLGKVVMPCCVAEATGGLTRLDTPGDLPAVPIWVACHQDMAHVSRVAAVRRYLVSGLNARAAQLAGRQPT